MRLRRGLESRIPIKIAAFAAALCGAGSSFAEEAKKGIISPTVAWNETWHDVLTDLFIIGGVFGVVALYLLIKYRAKSPDAVGAGFKMNLERALAWALVPAALFMADDFLLAAKGWSLWNVQRTVPANALEVNVKASQWFFEFDYGNGVTDGDLIVPVGRPIVLRMTATDVIHSFGLTEYRLKEDLLPGRITHLWFYPDKPLETNVTCVEFCGDSHSQMNSVVKAVPKAEFDAWLASKVKKTSSLPQNSYASASTAPSL
jgi:cytochrome c oxidase subunit 2